MPGDGFSCQAAAASVGVGGGVGGQYQGGEAVHIASASADFQQCPYHCPHHVPQKPVRTDPEIPILPVSVPVAATSRRHNISSVSGQAVEAFIRDGMDFDDDLTPLTTAREEGFSDAQALLARAASALMAAALLFALSLILQA